MKVLQEYNNRNSKYKMDIYYYKADNPNFSELVYYYGNNYHKLIELGKALPFREYSKIHIRISYNDTAKNLANCMQAIYSKYIIKGATL